MPHHLHKTLKQQLHDVHLPVEIGWWPLALGWWLLALLLLLILGGISFYFIKHHTQNRYRQIALDELNACYEQWQETQQSITNEPLTSKKNNSNNSNSIYLKTACNLLRRCIMHQQQASHLVNIGKGTLISTTGKRWLEVVNQLSNFRLSEETQAAITDKCYHAAPRVDIHHVHQELSQWIKSQKTIGATKQAKIQARSANHA